MTATPPYLHPKKVLNFCEYLPLISLLPATGRLAHLVVRSTCSKKQRSRVDEFATKYLINKAPEKKKDLFKETGRAFISSIPLINTIVLILIDKKRSASVRKSVTEELDKIAFKGTIIDCTAKAPDNSTFIVKEPDAINPKKYNYFIVRTDLKTDTQYKWIKEVIVVAHEFSLDFKQGQAKWNHGENRSHINCIKKVELRDVGNGHFNVSHFIKALSQETIKDIGTHEIDFIEDRYKFAFASIDQALENPETIHKKNYYIRHLNGLTVSGLTHS